MNSAILEGTCHMQLGVTDQFSAAARLVTASCYGHDGVFAYEAFDWVNATLFDSHLPTPLILWELTAHGACLGQTRSYTDGREPRIRMHPSTLRASEKENPWGVSPRWLGPAYALDLLIHECIHISVNYLLGGAKGPTSHNNPQWVGEVNRIGNLLGLDFVAGRSVTKRVPVESGELGPSGKPKTWTVRVVEGDASVPFDAVARFPHAVRDLLGQADAYYTANAIPFDNILTGPCHTQLDVTESIGGR